MKFCTTDGASELALLCLQLGIQQIHCQGHDTSGNLKAAVKENAFVYELVQKLKEITRLLRYNNVLINDVRRLQYQDKYLHFVTSIFKDIEIDDQEDQQSEVSQQSQSESFPAFNATSFVRTHGDTRWYYIPHLFEGYSHGDMIGNTLTMKIFKFYKIIHAVCGSSQFNHSV